MQSDIPRVLVKRFKIALWMTFALVPFMLAWNLYGNVMIKEDYFTNSHAHVAPQPTNSTDQTNTTLPEKQGSLNITISNNPESDPS